MKQLNISISKAYSQKRQGTKDASVVYGTFYSPPLEGSERGNVFPIKNEGKSPPGKARSPGSSLGGQNRDWIPYVPNKLIINNKEEIFQISNNQYSNFNNNLIFKIMKKQILLLVLAFFAAVTAFGQMIKGSDPQLINCTPGPLTPSAGFPYDYSALVVPADGNFTWWATKDIDFIKNGVNNLDKKLAVGPTKDLINTSPNYGIAGGATNASAVNITWSGQILANTTDISPTFVIVQNDATGTNCANNLKVYQIKPLNAFIVDIKNMDQAKAPLAYATPYSFCVSNVASAKFGGGVIVADYGTNVMYFEVVAANFTGSFTPSFKVSGLQTGQSVTSLELFTDAAFATAPITTTPSAAPVIYSPAAPVAVDGSVTNTSNRSIVICETDHCKRYL